MAPQHLAISQSIGFFSGMLSMPTILRRDGYRVVIYPNDPSPAHVHVIGKNAEAVFELHCTAGPVTLRESYHLKKRELRRLMKELNPQLPLLCEEWKKIHDAD